MTADIGGCVKTERVVQLTVPSDPKFMRLVRAVVACTATTVGFQKSEINSLCLAVDEACTNIIRHAYHGDPAQRIEVNLRLCPDGLSVRLCDWGEKVDPASIKPRELNDIRPGGLGVHFIRQIMDEAVYDPRPGQCTELRMMKALKKG